MKLINHVTSEDFLYIYPMGDIHLGDKNVDHDLLQRNLAWIKDEPRARVIGMGDILNVATRGSKSSPFDQTCDLEHQIKLAIKYFKPIKDKVVGIISGNHEQRLSDFVGYDPLSAVCGELGIPYLGMSAVIIFRMKFQSTRNREVYSIFAHHTTGGGGTMGGKLNRAAKLQELCANADIYLGAHNHQLAVAPCVTTIIDHSHSNIRNLRQLIVNTGSYLKWEGGYSERGMLRPVKLGSPRLRIDSSKKDVHCSL